MRELAELLTRFRYKPGWSFALDERTWREPTLKVELIGVDSVSGNHTTVTHVRPVPRLDEDYPTLLPNRQHYWEEWLLGEIIKIETHEAMEFFTVDGAAPYFPDHGARAYEIVRRETPFPTHRPEGYRVMQIVLPGSLEARWRDPARDVS